MADTLDNVPGWVSDLHKIGLEVGRSVRSSVDIDASADQVWNAISKRGNLKDCHPFCAETNVLSWPGKGSRDTITYLSGFTYTRNFVAWFEGVGYDIELGDRPNTTARVLWRIENNSDNRSMLSIEVVPFIKTELSDKKKCLFIERLFGSVLQHYLDCVVRGYGYHVTTGKSVTSNQFGRNPHYSAR